MSRLGECTMRTNFVGTRVPSAAADLALAGQRLARQCLAREWLAGQRSADQCLTGQCLTGQRLADQCLAGQRRLSRSAI